MTWRGSDRHRTVAAIARRATSSVHGRLQQGRRSLWLFHLGQGLRGDLREPCGRKITASMGGLSSGRRAEEPFPSACSTAGTRLFVIADVSIPVKDLLEAQRHGVRGRCVDRSLDWAGSQHHLPSSNHTALLDSGGEPFSSHRSRPERTICCTCSPPWRCSRTAVTWRTIAAGAPTPSLSSRGWERVDRVRAVVRRRG